MNHFMNVSEASNGRFFFCFLKLIQLELKGQETNKSVKDVLYGILRKA